MRYAALLTASAATLAVFTLPRDGRSESMPAVQAASPAAQSAAAPALPAATRQNGQEDFRWSGRVARGDKIEIRGLMGAVRAEPASGDQVEVVGRRVGDNADQVRIEVVETDDGVLICAIYPMERSTRRGNENARAGSGREGACSNANAGEMNLTGDEPRIEFAVRVPAGVRFTARNIQGDIHASNLRGAVDAASVGGNVRVSTTGAARAATVNGNVEATFGQTDGEDMTFASVSGNVVVRMASSVGAEVVANTLSGDIETDFALRVRGKDNQGGGFQIGQQASGTIGRGGPELTLSTVSGNIRLLRN
ncbi:MAG TPA: hypothetical protein VE871_08190 [Longimicrobium sp.]|nr:hypothetical protein [Longimicrobium sp.]